MKCEIFNYIPYKKSKNVTYEKWFKFYKYEIADLYMIVINNFRKDFDDSCIDWEKNFVKFSRLLYSKSSKYIMKEEDFD